MTALKVATPSALFNWPAQCKVARPVSKTKIYAHAKPSAALRALFVQQIDSITWGYKLAPASTNLPATPSVPEIEVFDIALRQPELNPALLRCIDKAIPFPILFVLHFAGRSQAIAAHKRPKDAANGAAPNSWAQWVVGDYHAAPWQKDDAPKPSLPVALDLQGLYEQLLRQHLPSQARPGEPLRDQLDRLALLAAAQAAAAKLQARLAQEVQFNHKVELNAQLRSLRSEVEALAV